MKRLLKRIILIHTAVPLSFDEGRRVFMIQLAGVTGIIVVLVFSLFFLIADNAAFPTVAVTSPIPVAFFTVGIVLNMKHHFGQAKFVFMCGMTLSTAISTSLFLGKASGLHYFFLLFAVIPSLIWSLRQWGFALFFMVLNVAGFFYIEMWPPPARRLISEIPPEWETFFFTASILTVYLTILGILIVSQVSVDRDGKQLARETARIEDLMLKYEALSRLDPLTELLNRRAMVDYLKDEVTRTRRTGGNFCILMCDIDNFKNVNDAYGHDCGDYVLQGFSRILENSLRETDRICRWGGEEFCILMPDTELSGAGILAERIRENIVSTKFRCRETELQITATIGVAVHEPSADLNDTIRNADRALYAGKRKGRNCSMVFDAEASLIS